MLSAEEQDRYARQITLPELGVSGQERLKRGSVLVIGAGGLGSPVAMYLAAAGVGTLGLVDFDTVDASNLHRQLLYGTNDVGRSKLLAATARIREINESVRVVPHEVKLTSWNAMEIIAAYDIVVDGTDNFAARYLVNDACVLLRKPNVYGSIYRFDGQLSVFDATAGPCYRCLQPEPPPPGFVPSCAEGGVIGVLPGIVGTLQAAEAIKLLTGIGESLRGRLLLIDVLRMQFRSIAIAKNPRCTICGPNASITALIDYDEFCRTGPATMNDTSNQNDKLELTPSELAERLQAGGVMLVDVREPNEWAAGHIDGARHIPLGQLQSELGSIPQDANVVLYCRGGGRSGRALAMMRNAGYSNAQHLAGGITAWAREKDPSITVA